MSEGDLIAQPLLIVCAGGYARETAALLGEDERWRLLGFADDDEELHGADVGGLPVLGSPEQAIAEAPHALVVVCQARTFSDDRRRLVARLALSADRYATVVHRTASVGGAATIGPGSVLLSGVVMTSEVSIGSHVAVMPGSVLLHDVTIEDYVTLAAGARIGGGVRVEQGAYVGMGALLRDGITVGAGALVGMGAVVTRSVPPGEVWFGAPARAHGNVTDPAVRRLAE